jgi:hypothetical protein
MPASTGRRSSLNDQEVRQTVFPLKTTRPSSFGATADLIAEGDYVVGQWKGGGTHNDL